MRHIGILLSELKIYWAEKDFKPTEEELMEELPKMYAAIQEQLKAKRTKSGSKN